jgi:hypothetical protein
MAVFVISDIEKKLFFSIFSIEDNMYIVQSSIDGRQTFAKDSCPIFY